MAMSGAGFNDDAISLTASGEVAEDALDTVMQQIRKLIEQLLQQSEEIHAAPPIFQVSVQQEDQEEQIASGEVEVSPLSSDIPIDTLPSLPLGKEQRPPAPVVVHAVPPEEPETPVNKAASQFSQKSYPSSGRNDRNDGRTSSEKRVNSGQIDKTMSQKSNPSDRNDERYEKRRFSTGGLQVDFRDLRKKQRSPSGRSMSACSMSNKSVIPASECSDVARFGLREGWENLNGSFFVKTPRAFYTIQTDEDSTARWVRFERFRQVWAILAVFLILRDCAFVPLMIFGRTDNLWVFETFAAFFWIANIPMSCWIASRSKDTDWTLCLAQTFVDVVLVAPTIVDLVGDYQSYAGAIIFRGLQLGRVLQVPHWYRVTGLSGTVREWLRHRSREFRAFWNLFWIFLIGCLFLHCLTCLWFYFGVTEAEGWVREIGLHEDPNWINQYLRSFEWAVSRLPPSHLPENMKLRTRFERYLAIYATGFMLLFGAGFTSIVTNDVSDIRRAARSQKEAQFQVTDFFDNFSVPVELKDEVTEYLRRSVAKVHQPSKQDIKAFLPEYLFGELCREAFSPIVKHHKLFHTINYKYSGFQYDLCTRCLQDWDVVPGEILFSAGPLCEHMLFVSHGSIRYRKLTDAADVEETDISEGPPTLRKNLSVIPGKNTFNVGNIELLDVGDWICELCLWTAWTYCGKSVAGAKGATLLCLKPERLLEIVAGHKDAAVEMAIYAHAAVQEVNMLPDEELSDTLRFEVDLE